MIPYTFVLEPGLIVYKICMDYGFFGRLTNAGLRRDLRRLGYRNTRTIGLVAGGQVFHPYGKSCAQTIGEQDWDPTQSRARCRSKADWIPPVRHRVRYSKA